MIHTRPARPRRPLTRVPALSDAALWAPSRALRGPAIMISVSAFLAVCSGDSPTLAPCERAAPIAAAAASVMRGHQMPPAAVATRAPVGLVDVDARLPDATASGTGIVVSSNGEIVTNYHVVTGASAITITDPATGRTYTAAVLGADAGRDIAVLQVQDADGISPAVLADSSDVQIGDPVEAAGNAGGRGGAPTITTGHVTGLRKSVTAQDDYRHQQHRLTGMIQIDATVRPGDSGGPLLSERGVIGMDTAAESNGSGFAIPINTVLAIARRIESTAPTTPDTDEQTLRTRASGLDVRPVLAIG